MLSSTRSKQAARLAAAPDGANSDGVLHAPTREGGIATGLHPIAERIRAASIDKWGAGKAVEVVGACEKMATLLGKVEKFARFKEPILITGESGVGKDLIARACSVLSDRCDRPYIAVNCPQYQEGNLTVSELFGHRKGSFTGAVSDHKGLFERADGGVIFLDEIGDLPMAAQVMLLRALAEGEFKPVGATESQSVNVRVIAATNRPLKELMVANEFRNDLYFRLCYFRLEIPSLRERDDDWMLLCDYFLEKLRREYGVRKRFSDAALRLLENYKWPGNLRELRSIVTVGYTISDGDVIEPGDFLSEIAGPTPERVADLPSPIAVQERPASQSELYVRMVQGRESFWDAVYPAFMNRDLNRTQVRDIIQTGLGAVQGSYKRLITHFNMPVGDYHKYMDFLRHHRLKAEDKETNHVPGPLE